MRHRQSIEAIAALLARLDCRPDTEPASLLLGASTTGALRELMEQRSVIDASLKAATEEQQNARQHAEEAEAALTAAGSAGPAMPSDQLAGIRAALTLARADDSAVRLRLAVREHAEKRATLEERLRDLRPWSGDAVALRDLTVPAAEEIEIWKAALAEAERRIDRQDAEIQRLSAEQRGLTAELDAAGQVSGVVNDAQAAKVRAAREQAWASHTRSLNAQTAEAFEASLRRDDILTGNRIGAAAEMARLVQVGRAHARVTADLDAELAIRAVVVESLEALQGELAAGIRQVSPALPHDWTSTRLASWIDARQRALESLQAVDTADREQCVAEQDGSRIRRRLADVATAAGIGVADDGSVDALVSTLQLAIDRDAEHRTLRSDVDARDRQQAERDRHWRGRSPSSSSGAQPGPNGVRDAGWVRTDRFPPWPPSGRC